MHTTTFRTMFSLQYKFVFYWRVFVVIDNSESVYFTVCREEKMYDWKLEKMSVDWICLTCVFSLAVWDWMQDDWTALQVCMLKTGNCCTRVIYIFWVTFSLVRSVQWGIRGPAVQSSAGQSVSRTYIPPPYPPSPHWLAPSQVTLVPQQGEGDQDLYLFQGHLPPLGMPPHDRLCWRLWVWSSLWL